MPCIRSKDFNAGFHCSITPRREGPWSLAADSESKYRTIPLPHSRVFATPTVSCGKRNPSDPPSGDAMCLSYRRLIQRLIAEARRQEPDGAI